MSISTSMLFLAIGITVTLELCLAFFVPLALVMTVLFPMPICSIYIVSSLQVLIDICKCSFTIIIIIITVQFDISCMLHLVQSDISFTISLTVMNHLSFSNQHNKVKDYLFF